LYFEGLRPTDLQQQMMGAKMHLRQFPERERFLELAGAYTVVPVCSEVLADTETPVSLLHKAQTAGKQPLFLLESVEGGEKWGRYSFMGVSAQCHLRIFAEAVVITRNGDEVRLPHHQDPLGILKSVAADYRAPDVPGLPRFWGGLVGRFNYEMVSFFEKIPHDWPADQPLGHFIIPDEVLIFDNIKNTLLCLALAFTEGKVATEVLYDETCRRLNNLLELLAGPLRPGVSATGSTADQALPVALGTPVPDDDFRAQVAKVKDHILAGDVIQTVISQPFTCDNPPDSLSLYRAQRYINPSPYLFFLDLGDGVLVGSSPETMVRLESGVATLRPIAGTRPRGATEQEDRALASELLADEKERAEHLMLVDLGRNDLGRVASIGTVQVTDLMVVERYSHVMHLVSNIICDLKPEVDAWDLIRATFPAGTLSGAPKVRAMEIIADLEETPRGPYGGAVGYIAFNGNMDLAITIRTAELRAGKLTVQAGAGIVADSDPERERMETVNKARGVGKALELACAGGVRREGGGQ
jgi:anthranilate synthase component I